MTATRQQGLVAPSPIFYGLLLTTVGGAVLSVVAQNRFKTPMMKLKAVSDSEVILLSSSGTIESAVAAIKLGAFDFLIRNEPVEVIAEAA